MSVSPSFRTISQKYFKIPRPPFMERLARALFLYKVDPKFSPEEDYKHLNNHDLSWVGRKDTMMHELGKYYDMVTARGEKRKQALKKYIVDATYRLDEILYLQMEVKSQISALEDELNQSPPNFESLKSPQMQRNNISEDYEKHISLLLTSFLIESTAVAWKYRFEKSLDGDTHRLQGLDAPYAKLIKAPSIYGFKSTHPLYQEGSILPLSQVVGILAFEQHHKALFSKVKSFQGLQFYPSVMEFLHENKN